MEIANKSNHYSREQPKLFLNTENLDNQLYPILKDDAITGYYYNKLSESGLSNIPVLLMAEVLVLD